MFTTALLAALAATTSANAVDGAIGASDARTTPRVAATGTASIRIQRGFRLTPASAKARVPGAQRATREISDADGIVRTASLVEFE